MNRKDKIRIMFVIAFLLSLGAVIITSYLEFINVGEELNPIVAYLMSHSIYIAYAGWFFAFMFMYFSLMRTTDKIVKSNSPFKADYYACLILIGICSIDFSNNFLVLLKAIGGV